MKPQGLVIGITGGLGAGKTTVSEMFASLGAKVLNADRIAHELIKPRTVIFKKILKTFGPSILEKNKINRQRLGELVFNDERLLKKLNSIIHPKVIQEIRKEINRFKKKNEILVVEAALLFESGLDRWMDMVVLVKSHTRESLKRAAKRLNISEREARARTNRQMSVTEKQKFADIIIDNRGSLKKTKQQVEDIWQKALLKTRKI